MDVQLPGLLNAATVHAPRLGARPASVNDADARSMPGVRQVVKAVTNAIFSATGVRIRRLPVARGMLSG
jgi:isoquinoline 1-oxidoreductase beta subunit